MADTHSEWRTERRGDPGGRSNSWLDDRGVSEVIGSILVFGLLVALLAIVQTQAVPNSNQEVEATHSNSVQGDLADLQSAISRTGTFGGSESVTVETGMTYPPRLVLYNPPSVQGTLATGQPGNVSIEGFSAPNPDTHSYIGSDPNFTSHAISYRVDYNRYSNAPETRYEYGVLVNQYENATEVESGTGPVSGRFISLTLLRGGLQESQIRPASVTTYPVSAPAQRVIVESGAQPANLTVSTGLSDEVWVSDILHDQIDTNATVGTNATDCNSLNNGSTSALTTPNTNDERYVVGCTYRNISGGPNELTLHLQSNQSYRLGMSKVGFNAAAEPTSAAYVTDVSPSANELVVEVRDRFNNPVERRVDLVLRRSDGSLENITTGPDGRANIQDEVEPDLIRPAAVSLRSSVPSDCVANRTCAVVEPPGLSAASNIRVTDVSADDGEDSITFTFHNQGDRDTNITEVQLGYATQRTEREFTVSGGSLQEVIEGDTQNVTENTFSTSLVSDGPDEITEITAGGSPYDNGPPAVENGEPVTFTNGDGQTAALVNGTRTDVTYHLQGPFSLEGENSVDLSVTVYYEDGSVATYSRTLFQENGESEGS